MSLIFSLRLSSLRMAALVLPMLLLMVPAGAAQTPLQGSVQAPDPDDRSPHSEAALVAETRAVQPGEPFTVALRLTMEEGWHSYWQNPGDAGQPTSIDWDLPEGFEAGAIQWPYPHRIEAGPLTNYGYSDEVLLLVEVTSRARLAPGAQVTLAGEARWLICADICLPAGADLRLTLPVQEDPPPPSAWQDAIAEARARLPVRAEGWDVQAVRSEGSYALRLTAPEEWDEASLEGAYFFPGEKGVLAHAAPQPVSREGEACLIALQQSAYAQEQAERLTGVLVAPDGRAWNAEGARAMAVDVPVREAASVGVAAERGAAGGMTLAWALVLAFAGGLLLNLMPCVFPILSIKILGFARQSGERKEKIRAHGLVFGAGVVVSFWVLAGALLALRAAGSQIGWGFQLQSPLFVALMALLFFGIGLNLMGAFEVGSSLMRLGGRAEQSASGGGYGGSFLSGVLATVVGTPCTAPLMGAALGVALTRAAPEALLIFTALGLGMAAPYVLLSMTPRLLRRLPRPGRWMETLRQALAFPMFAAAVWLVWVFGRQVSTEGMALLLLALLAVALAGWILGRWQAHQITPRARLVTRSLAAVAVGGAVALALLGAAREPATAASASADVSEENAAWQPFSTERVESLRAEGRPVFIDFTAAWCLTCQVNKRVALSDGAVQQAFDEKGVVRLRADWTSRDPEITRALARHGRSGVPLYVLYPGDGSGAVLLPAILTQNIVLDALRPLPDASATARTASAP